ncbi:hypothetical protein [Actinomadura rifamycini]|uniref:hypothetical protein n=1 Tax=Actinomadura rifamycini TaxID=31962 RepID=UPI0004050598|nr:hypothetical protein [Actinomadura rifamycini]
MLVGASLGGTTITGVGNQAPDNPYDVRTLDTSHAGFIFRADEVATLLTTLPL